MRGPKNSIVPLTIQSIVGYSVAGAIDEGNVALQTHWEAYAKVQVGIFLGKGQPGADRDGVNWFTYADLAPGIVTGIGNSIYGAWDTPAGSDLTGYKRVPVDLQTNQVYAELIFADASAYQPFPQPDADVHVHAFADPVVSFDTVDFPNFDFSPYTLEFNPASANDAPSPAPEAPERSTLVISSILLGVVGVVRGYMRLRGMKATA